MRGCGLVRVEKVPACRLQLDEEEGCRSIGEETARGDEGDDDEGDTEGEDFMKGRVFGKVDAADMLLSTARGSWDFS